MNFTSQICTTKEQSERLLTLGLKKETADMCIDNMGNIYTYPITIIESIKNDWGLIPLWSLNRLIEMIPSFIDIGEHNYMFRMIQGRVFSYRSDIAGNVLLCSKGNVYDTAIYTIEWLIGEGCFNKEYFEEKNENNN